MDGAYPVSSHSHSRTYISGFAVAWFEERRDRTYFFRFLLVVSGRAVSGVVYRPTARSENDHPLSQRRSPGSSEAISRRSVGARGRRSVGGSIGISRRCFSRVWITGPGRCERRGL